jgi:hypothetical protein
VYKIRAKINPAAGVRACTNVLESAASDRKNMDIVRVAKKLTKKKKKKLPGSLLRLVIK